MLVRFFKRLRKLYQWFPIVWRDQDWDNYYLEVVLHYKLTRMYKFFTSEDAVTNWKINPLNKSLKALRICINILERRRSNFYVAICPDVYNSRDVLRSTQVEERDLKVLGRLIGTYLSWWWD
jgi:hypothetical protein